MSVVWSPAQPEEKGCRETLNVNDCNLKNKDKNVLRIILRPQTFADNMGIAGLECQTGICMNLNSLQLFLVQVFLNNSLSCG